MKILAMAENGGRGNQKRYSEILTPVKHPKFLTVKQEVPKTTNTDAQNQSEPVGADVE